MSNAPVRYKYKHDEIDYNVSFLNKNGHQMINATEMAKPFNKNATHWLRNQQSQDYIEAYCELRNCNSTDLLQVTYGNNGGTWMHEDIALEFARWLSPKFAIWCNDKIKELLKNGYVYLKTASPNELNEHVNHQVQRENSKAIAMKNYGVEKNQQKIINHFRDITYRLVGVYPIQIKSWGRNNGVPESVISKGSREVLRYISSSATACMSLIENIIASNPDMTIDNIDELMPYVIELEPFFRKMIEIGHINPKDSEKIKLYKELKQNNEK